ncbi:MAG: TIM-barrel domain-containing protein [Bacteroidales bacterium]
MKRSKVILPTLLFFSLAGTAPVQLSAMGREAIESNQEAVNAIVSARLINPTTVELLYADNKILSFDFYGNNIIRLFQDNNGGIIRNPQATPPAQILVDNPRKDSGDIRLSDSNGEITIESSRVKIVVDKKSSLFRVTDLNTGKCVLETTQPVSISPKQVSLQLKASPREYFYGGGVQNGRFSHKGKVIAIENTNNWTDGGVASPTPYYWSTGGYGVMWHTFKKGKYDFGSEQADEVKLMHEDNYLDLFLMVNDSPVALLNDFYQLTGNPALMPKFGFYEGHLNAYNRDYWKEDEKGILFEDGKRYKESQKENGGIKESLNGEKDNYQFSARAVIDRYNAHDMPLGWVLPNDGYGAGYGQTGTLDGNIGNLKEFGDYAREKGVEIGLWTQSDLHPKEGIEALLQRDIVKEVRDAGVRVLKTDVAWVGAGYSFGLNGVADVGNIMPYYGNDARPFIISLDGWAGTQRYAGIWSGDQTGGEWEYIRFHIPTYIGSGLSGQPNISSDMDGIFGGKNMQVNIRDFQWKTFTPAQLNMDGWGANPKYPHILGEPATSINRWYLKMKSEFMPYAYTIAKESVDGKPMIRAMFLDDPNDFTLGTATRYQYLYGPYVLVAPVYQNTKADEEGNDIRHGIYLPEGNWVDYFTGEVYAGNRVINSFDVPLWKIPVFIKQGAILPMTNPNNNPNQIRKDSRIYDLYPYGETTFTEYDDDGLTQAYIYGKGAQTVISSKEVNGNVSVKVAPATGSFDGMQKEKSTWFRVNVSEQPKSVSARTGGKKVKLTPVFSMEELAEKENVYFYEAKPDMNVFATKGTPFAEKQIIRNPLLHVKLAHTDVTRNEVELNLKGYVFDMGNSHLKNQGKLNTPVAQMQERGPYTLTPSWNPVAGADYYEIKHNDQLYTLIKDTCLLFDELKPLTDYHFEVCAVNKDGKSAWSSVDAKTLSNPLEFAIKGIRGETTCENQGSQRISKLFNFDEKDMWHTKWQKTAVPFDLIMDLRSVNVLDRFEYLPRTNKGNGIWQKGTVYYSMDKKNWTEAGSFEWEGTDVKTFGFTERSTARFIKISVTDGAGGYGSGRELYVFRQKGTESYIPGDINLDGKIDENDFTSYMNYTGLRKADSDFDYVSKGDLNNNGLIDAYDISNVATELEEGASQKQIPAVSGEILITESKRSAQAGEVIELIVTGKDLQSVNAISFAIPYETKDWEFAGIEADGMKEMQNLTYDRLHTNGAKALYPTFVNKGDKEMVEGSGVLMKIKFKARRKASFDKKILDGIIVDKYLNTIAF